MNTKTTDFKLTKKDFSKKTTKGVRSLTGDVRNLRLRAATNKLLTTKF
jgi:hypothetical protein